MPFSTTGFTQHSFLVEVYGSIDLALSHTHCGQAPIVDGTDLDRFSGTGELLVVLTAMKNIWNDNLDFLNEVVDHVLGQPEREEREELHRRQTEAQDQ